MDFRTSFRAFLCLCCCLFLAAPSKGFNALQAITMNPDDLNDFITAHVIGAVIRDIHSRASKDQDNQEQDAQASFQGHHPVFLHHPWHQARAQHPHMMPLPPMMMHPMHQMMRNPHPQQMMSNPHPQQMMSNPHPQQMMSNPHPQQMMANPHPQQMMANHHPQQMMPLIHAEVAQWVHPHVLAAHLQQQQFQHQMLASHQPLRSLVRFEPLDPLHHPWHPRNSPPGTVFQAVNFR